MNHIQLVIWEMLCIAIFYSAFCRAVHMRMSTRSDIRLANWFAGVFSMVGVAAPLYEWEPDLMIILLATSIVLIRISTARSWSRGMPDAFLKTEFRPSQNRRLNDTRGDK